MNEVLVDYLIDRIIKPGSAPSTRSHYCLPQCCMIIRGRIDQKTYLIVERDDHHAIIWLELIYKGDGRLLHLVKLEVRRAAGVDHQHNREWLFSRGEISDLLFDPVILESKILFAQIRNVLAIAIHYAHRNRDKRRVNAHDVTCPNFFRSICGRLTALSTR